MNKLIHCCTMAGCKDLNPSRQVTTQDGKTVMQADGKTPFTVLTWGPLKGEQRMKQKAENELKGDYSQILDVVRCSVIVLTEEQLHIVALTLQARRRAYERKTPQQQKKNPFSALPYSYFKSTFLLLSLLFFSSSFSFCLCRLGDFPGIAWMPPTSPRQISSKWPRIAKLITSPFRVSRRLRSTPILPLLPSNASKQTLCVVPLALNTTKQACNWRSTLRVTSQYHGGVSEHD